MPRDRMPALRRALANQRQGAYDEGNGTDDPPPYDDAVAINMDSMEGQGLSDFFETVEELRKLIEKSKNDVDAVKKKHSQIISIPVPDNKNKQELEDLMSSIKSTSNTIRARLKEIERGIQKEEESNEEREFTPAKIRIKKTQHSSLLRAFIDVMNEYQLAQTDYRDRCKARIKRQLGITGSTMNEEEVENMIEQGNLAVFTQGIIMESEQAKQMLADVEARHSDILQLEKSLKELHELFLEVALLVERQGEVVDRIETQVNNTKEYVEEGNVQLTQAMTNQRAARRKKFWIIGIIIIIIIVLVLIIYYSV